MPRVSRSFTALALLAALLAYPQRTSSQASGPTPSQALPRPAMGAAAAESTSTPAPSADTSAKEASSGLAPRAQDSLTVPKSRADTVLIPKHTFNHRQQIITGSVVMTCLILMLVFMNNYNPR